jgi:hypothetical protein
MKVIDLGNGAECEIYTNGDKCWYLNGKLHRTDGPAIEWANDSKSWWMNGEYHRTNGPAIEYANGSKFWYINGIEYSEEDFNQVKQVLGAI